ncbi:MAG TPA: hypothetical protein VGB03_01090 [Acidimicrobiales bacterium]|jgi:hypothetical protein
MRRVLALGVVVGVFAVGAAGCSRDRLRADEARLTLSGRALVSQQGGPLKPVDADRRLRAGDRVKLVAGSARVEAGDGTTYELRCGGDACGEGSDFEWGSEPTLLNGEVLVAAARKPVVLEAAGSEVEVTGMARVSRSLAVSAAAYKGEVVLRSGGRPFTLPALRQAAIPALGVLPTTAAPVAYDESDEWDRRVLGVAIAFGRELEARSQAFGANLRTGEGRTAGFYKLVVPALDAEPAFDASLVDGRRGRGETLVGAVIASKSKKAPFAQRWREVFAFRDEGAAWGLVALDQGVSEGAQLVSELDAAIGRAPLQFSGPSSAAAAPTGPSTPPPTGGPATRSTTPSTSTTTTTRPPTGGTTTTTPPPTGEGPLPSPTTGSPVDPVLVPLVDPVVDTLNGLLP